jgi:hypothetical protein
VRTGLQSGLGVLPATAFHEGGNKPTDSCLKRVGRILVERRRGGPAVDNELLGFRRSRALPALPPRRVALRAARISGGPQDPGRRIAHDGGQPSQRPVTGAGDPVPPSLKSRY